MSGTAAAAADAAADDACCRCAAAFWAVAGFLPIGGSAGRFDESGGAAARARPVPALAVVVRASEIITN